MAITINHFLKTIRLGILYNAFSTLSDMQDFHTFLYILQHTNVYSFHRNVFFLCSDKFKILVVLLLKMAFHPSFQLELLNISDDCIFSLAYVKSWRCTFHIHKRYTSLWVKKLLVIIIKQISGSQLFLLASLYKLVQKPLLKSWHETRS